MRQLRDVPVWTIVKRVGLAALVGLIAVAAVGALVSSRAVDEDRTEDKATEWEHDVASCKGGNVVRGQLRDHIAVTQGVTGVITTILDAALADPGDATPEEVAFVHKQVEVLRRLAAALRPPSDRDCMAIYGPPPPGAVEPPDPTPEPAGQGR